MAQIVIADASPLIILSQVDGLLWLRLLFGQIFVTGTVQKEILPDGDKPGKKQIMEAFHNGTLVLLPETYNTPVFPTLDEGEASCIQAALKTNSQVLLLMDERLGRAISQENGLTVLGTVGFVIIAKKQKLIKSASNVFKMLSQNGFWIAPELIREALKELGELQ